MSYQDELKEQAQKRAKRDHRNKMIMLVVFLIAVLAIIHFLGEKSKDLTRINPKVENVNQQTPQANSGK